MKYDLDIIAWLWLICWSLGIYFLPSMELHKKFFVIGTMYLICGVLIQLNHTMKKDKEKIE